MKRLFADTYYFLALLNEQDAAHERVRAFSAGFDGRLVTTDWVLTEVADAMAGLRNRARFAALLQYLRSHRSARLVRASAALFDEGVALYARRRDKEWSLTDCISFVVMQKLKLREALTGDRHFEQAGFVPLFR